MADGTVPYQNPTVTDGLLDCESLTVAAQTVKRERVQLAGATDVALAAVTNAAPTTEYGVVTRNIPSGIQPVSGANLDVALSTRLAEATFTGRTPAGASPADNESNTNAALSRIGTFSFIFDGVTWDRWTGAVTQGGVWNIGTVTTVTGITNPVAVTDNAGSLTVDNAGTFAVQATDNLTQINGVAVTVGTGAASANTPRVAVASDSAITANAGTNLNTSALLLDATFTTRINTQGQKTMAASTPVVLASDQASIPVTVASTTITGSVAVTGPLTDAQLRATPVPISGTVTATSAATATASDPLYVEATSNALSQDLAGNLRVRIRGMVSDTTEGLIDGTYRDVSLTNDGRLRVSTVPARYQVLFFSDNEEQMWGPDLQVAYAFSGSPWSEW